MDTHFRITNFLQELREKGFVNICEIDFEAFKALKEPHKTKYTVCIKAWNYTKLAAQIFQWNLFMFYLFYCEIFL